MQNLQKLGPYISGQCPSRRWRSSAGHHQMSRVSPSSGLQGWGLMNALPKSFEKKSMLQNSIRLAAFWHDHTIWHTEWTFVTEAWWFSFYVFRPLSMLPVHHNSALLWRSQQTAHYLLWHETGATTRGPSALSGGCPLDNLSRQGGKSQETQWEG